MRWLKTIAFCLLLSLGSAACSVQSGPVYQEMLDTSFKGQHIDKMVQEFGPPSEKTADAYTWKKKFATHKPGYWSEYTDIKYIKNRDGRVLATIEEDIPYRTKPYTIKRWCNTKAYFNADKMVTGFEFEGTDMDSTIDEHTGCYYRTSDKSKLVFRK
jgi:hypothetical protein